MRFFSTMCSVVAGGNVSHDDTTEQIYIVTVVGGVAMAT